MIPQIPPKYKEIVDALLYEINEPSSKDIYRALLIVSHECGACLYLGKSPIECIDIRLKKNNWIFDTSGRKQLLRRLKRSGLLKYNKDAFYLLKNFDDI